MSRINADKANKYLSELKIRSHNTIHDEVTVGIDILADYVEAKVRESKEKWYTDGWNDALKSKEVEAKVMEAECNGYNRAVSNFEKAIDNIECLDQAEKLMVLEKLTNIEKSSNKTL